MRKLTTKRVEWLIQQISQWYEIRQVNHVSEGRDPTRADVDHSSLLRRLLQGEKIYKYSPPLNHSYPDYEAASGREVRVTSKPYFHKDSVVLNQSRWKLLRKEKKTYIIQWPDDPAEWVLRPRTKKELSGDMYGSILKGEAYEDAMKEMRLKYNRWALKRLPHKDDT